MQELLTQSPESSKASLTAPSWQPADGPLFVVGMFRSGTSLLYALLNQHPQIALIYEGDLAHLHSLFWLPRTTAQWMAKWTFWNGALPRHNFDTSEIPAGISDLETAVRAVHVEYARQKKGATIWGCKSPIYYDEITRLSRTFPNARFVIIWRDPRSICRSIVAAQGDNIFFSRKGMLLRVLLGFREMKKQCDGLIRRGGKVHQLYYEDLVRDPATVLQEVCAFLQIPFDPRMTRLEGADRSAIQEGSHHKMVKSEKIVSSTECPDTLPPKLRSKIERYIHMWARQYNGTWPLYPQALPENTPDPSRWERWRDRIAYLALSRWHHFIPVVFSFVPLPVWKQYRRFIEARRFSRLREKNGDVLEAGRVTDGARGVH
jgi:hypothetical protein